MEFIKVEGYTDYKQSYEVYGSKRIMVINDLHIPKHNKKVVNIVLNRLNDYDTLIINGDLVDFEGVSRFKKHPKKRQIKDEIELVKEFLTNLRNNFSGKIIYKFGNHEKRLDDYIWMRAEALYDLEEISLEELLNLKELKIIPIHYNQLIKINELFVLHGHEVKATGNLVNIARQYLLKLQANMLIGHWHISQSYSSRDLKGKVKSVWVNGCMCDLYPEYNLFNQWEHGFAEIIVNKDKGFLVNLRRVINGGIY